MPPDLYSFLMVSHALINKWSYQTEIAAFGPCSAMRVIQCEKTGCLLQNCSPNSSSFFSCFLHLSLPTPTSLFPISLSHYLLLPLLLVFSYLPNPPLSPPSSHPVLHPPPPLISISLHLASFDEVHCLIHVHATPVIKYVAHTRSTVHEPHVILTTLSSEAETMKTTKIKWVSPTCAHIHWVSIKLAHYHLFAYCTAEVPTKANPAEMVQQRYTGVVVCG